MNDWLILERGAVAMICFQCAANLLAATVAVELFVY